MAKVTQAYAKIAALNPDGYLFYNLYASAEGYTNKGTSRGIRRGLLLHRLSEP